MVSGEYPPWKVAQRLGAGSLTEAFLVEGPQGAAVLKRLLPFYAEHELLCAAFVLRGEEVKALDHPAILKVFSTGAAGRDRFIVMEKAEGRALSRAIARMEQKGFPALPQIPVIACAYQAAKALAHAHSKGVLHLDVSLHNLYLAPNGVVRLADFGLAHTRRQYAPEAGSVELIPPELAQGAKPDPRVDIWQLAAATYTLLAGGLPPNALTRGFPPLNLRVDGADETLSALLMRSLSPIAAERPLAMAELVAGLGTWLDRAGVTDATTAAATLYRNLFEDSAEEGGWSIPQVLPWPDAEGARHRVFSAGEATPTSPKGPLESPGRRRRLSVAGVVTIGLLAAAIGLYNLARIGVLEAPEVSTPTAAEAARQDESVEAQPPPPGSIAIGELADSEGDGVNLPLSTSKLPVKFFVHESRHGFFVEDGEGAPMAVGGMKDAVLRVSGSSVIRALALGKSTGATIEQVFEARGAFAVLTDAGGHSYVQYVTDGFTLPRSVIEVRVGFFTERPMWRARGSARAVFSERGAGEAAGLARELSLAAYPSFHLDDGERFTVLGLAPDKDYSVAVEGARSGLVVVLRGGIHSATKPMIESLTSTVAGAAGQYLVGHGEFRMRGATSAMFTLPRKGRPRVPYQDLEWVGAPAVFKVRVAAVGDEAVAREQR